MSAWSQVAGEVGRIPAGVWMGAAAANGVLAVATWSAARRRLRRAGERVALSAAGARADDGGRRDTALTVAAMIPAALFWGMVLAGSLHGLVAFGRTVLGWHGGWEYLVPGTLDGVSVTFAFLAFRAVRKQKAPDQCQRVVWGAALASATVNFAYEYSRSGHNVVAGGYLGLLSLFGMVMFHEFLDQFEEGTGYVKRENPKFGLRWLTWPTNTFCAAVAWRNHPPVDGTAATVREAVVNLDRVRAVKTEAREAKVAAKHERDLAAERRRTELAAARTGAPDEVPIDAGGAVPESVTVPAPTRTISSDACPTPPAGQLRVPATAATLARWADAWVRMCADGQLAVGPITEDLARERYRLSGKQLRNIRHAAISGALRRRAGELGVVLPAGYVDRPVGGRINGHRPAGVAS
jgi:Protein of unknown function (DUF2637)